MASENPSNSRNKQNNAGIGVEGEPSGLRRSPRKQQVMKPSGQTREKLVSSYAGLAPQHESSGTQEQLSLDVHGT